MEGSNLFKSIFSNFLKVVDMRWGVRDEMTNEHQTTELCMTELRNCQRLSMGPNFIYFAVVICVWPFTPPPPSLHPYQGQCRIKVVTQIDKLT